MKRILPLIAAAVWISLSEFVRNEFLLKTYWTDHYQRLGLVFPDGPANGAVWGLWSLMYAGVIAALAEKYTLTQTILLAWIIGFAMMWVVIGNLGVLPFGILPYALPLSLLEAAVAAFIIVRWK